MKREDRNWLIGLLMGLVIGSVMFSPVSGETNETKGEPTESKTIDLSVVRTSVREVAEERRKEEETKQEEPQETKEKPEPEQEPEESKEEITVITPEAEIVYNIEPEEQAEAISEYEESYTEPVYETSGSGLTASGGVNYYGNQKETWYNMDIMGVLATAQNNGISGSYWIREDGCKMWGDYIVLACNRDVHPYGSLVETSLGTGISLDTGGFAAENPYQVDIATNW